MTESCSCHPPRPAIDPGAILRAEHRLIEQTVRCLAAIANLTRGSHRIPREDAVRALEVMGTFADRCHHGKEEDALFPALERVAPGSCSGLRLEHDAMREQVRGLRCSLDEDRSDLFAIHALRYAEELTRHIAAEDGQVLPLIAGRLDADARDKLLHAFHRHEERVMGAGTHERMIAMANDLAVRYGTKLAVDDPEVLQLLTAHWHG